MIKINLYIGSRYPVDRKKIKQKALEVLSFYEVDNVQLDISIVGKRKIKQLNEEYLNHEGPTDVLSFPMFKTKAEILELASKSQNPVHIGDIVISFPEAVNRAMRFGKLVDDQLCFYLEHGIMHLLGYHHDDH